MLFDPSTTPQLKPWLVRTLEPICDAEPGALAEYILALLKHNVPESDMRRELTGQLDEFLEKECPSFIDTLFTVLRTKSYLPYSTDSTPRQPRAMDTGIPIPLDALLLPSSHASPERGQKRSMEYDERDGRPAKGPRLSVDGGQGQFSRYPNGRGMGHRSGRPGIDGHDGGMHIGGMSMNGGMNGNMSYMNSRRPQGYQPPDVKRGLCRDYHNFGYCARGELCKFSHGEEAVIPGQLFPMNSQQIPGLTSQLPFMSMFPNGGMPFGMNGNVGGAYDPNEAHMDMRPLQQGGMGMDVGRNVVLNERPGPPVLSRMQHESVNVMHKTNASGELPVIQDLTPMVPDDEPQPQPDTQTQDGVTEGSPVNEEPGTFMEVEESTHVPSQSGFRGGMHGGSQSRGTHSSHGGAQQMRPQKGRGDKTLVVEKIPEDKLSLDSVNGWFKRFGTVTNVAVDVHSAKALVTFAEHEEAHKAWKSEDAVFNNRFVKLFWHRPMEGHGQGGARALAASASLVANINGKETTPAPTATTTTTTTKPPTLTVLPTFTTTTKRKSTTPSAAASALAAKQQLLEQQIAEQKSLMTQLTSASSEEKKHIMTRLRKLGEEMKPSASPAATPAPSPSPVLTSQKRSGSNPHSDEKQRREKERLDKELENHSITQQSEGAGEENTEDLKAKLARLKAEAASLGLAEAGSETHAYNGSYRPYNYRGRGRPARSFYRGSSLRGGPPRASMKLDNRPKKLFIKGVSDDSVQAIRDWYETTGQVDSVATSENGGIIVSFKSRSAAEQGLAKGQNITQIGPVQVSWYSGQPTMKGKAVSPALLSRESKDDKVEGDEPAHSSHKDEHHSHHPEEEVVASGWGGDGDEDGMGML